MPASEAPCAHLERGGWPVSKHLSDERNEAGKKGETAALDWLVQLYGLARVTKADKPLQDENIDFVVIPQGEPKLYLEVKTDRNIERTGNFALEMARIKHNLPLNRYFYPAWFIASRANMLIVYSPASRILYSIDMPAARRVANEYVREHRDRTQWRAVFTDFERTSINLLMPVNQVPHDRWQYNSDARFWEQAVAA